MRLMIHTYVFLTVYSGHDFVTACVAPVIKRSQNSCRPDSSLGVESERHQKTLINCFKKVTVLQINI